MQLAGYCLRRLGQRLAVGDQRAIHVCQQKADIRPHGFRSEDEPTGRQARSPSRASSVPAGEDFALFRNFVVHFALDPALWRDLNGRDAIEQIVDLSLVASGFCGWQAEYRDQCGSWRCWRPRPFPSLSVSQVIWFA
jgi:hypothetical protein